MYRGLAIFTQIEWGGIYLDNAAAARRMSESFDRISRLIIAADERDFTVDSPWRLLCLDSDFRDVSAVSWIRVPDADIDATWRFTTDRRVEPGTALPIAEDLMRVPPPPRKRR